MIPVKFLSKALEYPVREFLAAREISVPVSFDTQFNTPDDFPECPQCSIVSERIRFSGYFIRFLPCTHLFQIPQTPEPKD
ncbi:hypothetical protein GCM10010331_44950 [Streptomyces xanthochromogenes]|nr:hypothetical protein GCM10010331_44950 [Streptomyces xanthochromogenes]